MRTTWLKVLGVLIIVCLLASDVADAKKTPKKNKKVPKDDLSKDKSPKDKSSDEQKASETNPKMKPSQMRQNKRVEKKVENAEKAVTVPVLTDEVSVVKLPEDKIEPVNRTIYEKPQADNCRDPARNSDSLSELERTVSDLKSQLKAVSQPVHIHVHGGRPSSPGRHSYHGSPRRHDKEKSKSKSNSKSHSDSNSPSKRDSQARSGDRSLKAHPHHTRSSSHSQHREGHGHHYHHHHHHTPGSHASHNHTHTGHNHTHEGHIHGDRSHKSQPGDKNQDCPCHNRGGSHSHHRRGYHDYHSHHHQHGSHNHSHATHNHTQEGHGHGRGDRSHKHHFTSHRHGHSHGHYSPSGRHGSNYGGSHSTHVHIHVTVDEKTSHSPRLDSSHEEVNATEKAQHVQELPVYGRCDLRNHGDRSNLTGYVLLRQLTPNSLEIKVNISGFAVPPQGDASTEQNLHGFHVHEFADFSQGCLSFGSHYNPEGTVHGGLDDDVRHVGDWGNIEVDEQGQVISYFSVSDATLNGPHCILGRGIVVHEKVDDLGKGGVEASKTTGNAGGRLACCIIGVTKAIPDSSWN